MNPDGLPVLPGYMFDPTWRGLASLGLTIVLPIIVGMLTKASWPGGAKGVLLLALAAIKSFAEAWMIGDGTFDPERVAWAIGLNFAIAVTMQFGLYRSTITPKVQDMLIRDKSPEL